MLRRRTTIADFALALARVDGVLAEGERIHHGRWRSQPVAQHIRHAADHLAAWQDGDRSEDHLGHAACRLLRAGAV